MPSTFELPARRERHCAPCQFHKVESAFYGSDHSWRDYNCMHPDAFDDMLVSTDPTIAVKQGELRGRLLISGRNIGKTEKQPDWCPLKREPDNA